MKLNPFIKPSSNSTRAVMTDVIIALLPMVVAAWLAFGMLAINLIGVALLAAIMTDIACSVIFLKKYQYDGSAIITALLLSFTISPLTPWYVVAFGSACAILFGKIVWGGLGKNTFNPALVGREFMAVFFVTGANVWKTGGLVNIAGFQPATYFNSLIYKPAGAMGEYSILCIILGGFYLLIRKRISWHIPTALMTAFTILCWFGGDLKYSMAGILLGAIYMATDMPSSPTTPQGKMYYGAMIGIVTFIFIAGGIRFEYLSYSILLLNGFSHRISMVFQPRVWGTQTDLKARTEQVFLLTLSILAVALAVISLSYYNLVQYAIYLYLVYIIFKFNHSFSKKIIHPI